MSDVNITINGGNIQINPNATEGILIFCGDRLVGEMLSASGAAAVLPPEAQKLLLYIDKERLPHYLSLIAECQSAPELGKVVAEMSLQEPKLLKEEIVKERFISLILPLARKLTKGTSIDNVRARINDALANIPRQRRK